jgi:peptidoglycan L-alanyl-D-glutamate endopeptidase CwlK
LIEPKRNSDPKFLKPELAFKVGRLFERMILVGAPVRIIETARSIERQKWLWDSGRVRVGPVVTNAKPGESKHTPDLNGLSSACDFCFEGDDPFGSDQPWQLFGTEAEKIGLVWGGKWRIRDLGHVELP